MRYDILNFLNGLLKSKIIKSSIRTLLVCILLCWVWHQKEVEPMDWGKPPIFSSPPLDFEATAYCNQGVTSSGAPAGPGIVAADLAVLPMGTLIWLDAGDYSGVYQVMDTGRLVKGRLVDVFIPGEDQAIDFGRQKVKVIVLRYGHPGKLQALCPPNPQLTRWTNPIEPAGV